MGDILSDDAAHAAILNAFDKIETPEFYRAMIFDERNLSLQEALIMLPNYDDAVKMIKVALAGL